MFDVQYLVEFLSNLMTLEPGDIILTGTPGGVGVARNPQVFLKDGDVVKIEIDKIGALENKVSAVIKFQLDGEIKMIKTVNESIQSLQQSIA